MSYTVAIVGSNRFTEYHLMEQYMNTILKNERYPSKILSIGRRGACVVAQKWASLRSIDFQFLNGSSVDDFFKADLILALPHEGDAWTEQFIHKAEELGIEYHTYEV